MHITRERVWLWALMSMLVLFLSSIAAPAHAHVHWTRVNGVDPETVALYHFENTTSQVIPPSGNLDQNLGLTPFSGASSITGTADTPAAIFDPGALALNETQTLRTTATVTNLAGDLTIEFWFKWVPAMTSSTLEVGLASGARVMIARDTAVPVNDRFGVAGTHGSYVSAPAFTNWADYGEEEGSLNEWRHLALAIHSAGIHFDPVSAHDVYSTGTTGLLIYNGHPVGFLPYTFNLSGLKVHDASRLTVVMRGNGVVIDELTIWQRDWTENGTKFDSFSNGRGGQTRVSGWDDYDE